MNASRAAARSRRGVAPRAQAVSPPRANAYLVGSTDDQSTR
jgi:hypothetical protein